MKRVVTLLLLLVASAVAPAAMGAIEEQPVELAVEQPSYADGEVQRSVSDGIPVYTIQDGTADVQPLNLGNGTVVSYGVVTDGGQLSYSEQMDQYEFDAGDNTATFELYWEVEEQRAVQVNNSTEIQTVRTRYTAVIRVAQNQDYQHIPTSELEDRREAAANWSEWSNALVGIYGEGVDVETRTQQAVNYLRLAHNPLAVLSGQFSAVLLTLFITIGGGLVLALFGTYHIATRWSDLRYINRQESLKPGEQDVEDRVAALQDEERRRALQNLDWQDVFPDDRVARASRETLGETVFDGTVRLQELLLPENLVRDRLQAMGLNGWVGVDRDGDVTLAREDELGDVDEEDLVDLTTPADEFVDALDWNNSDLRTFDLASADISHQDVEDTPAVSLDGLDLEELMEELEVQERDFESPEVWGEYLREFVEDVRESPYCDEQGKPDTTRFVLNNWLQLSQTLRDRHDMPLFEFAGDAIERALIDIDPVADAESIVDDVEDGVGS